MRGYDDTLKDEPIISMATPKTNRGKTLKVPISLHMKSMVYVDCPELTPPGAAATRFHGRTKAQAIEARDQALKIARNTGKPIYSAKDGKKRRREWSSTGFPL